MRWIAAILAFGMTVGVMAQTPARQKLAFEVASIKPAIPMPAVFMPGTRLVCPLNGCGGPGTSDPGLMRFTDISLRHLIGTAYGVMPYRIEAPSWLDSAKFDIAATVPRGAIREQATLMLQNLLADRFQLKLHHSTKDLPVYMLVVTKNGARLKESADDPSGPSPDGGRAKGLGTSWITDSSGARVTKLAFDGWTMARFADTLTLSSDRPVIDMTGLMGKYDIRLEFAPDISNPHSTPDLFTALTEQLGLKLEAAKAPVEVIVIDSVSRPSEN